MAEPESRGPDADSRASWSSALPLLAVLAIALLVAFPYFESTRNANERPRLMQAMSLLEDGSFAIDGPSTEWLDAGPDISRNPETGRIYPNKPPGASLVGAPAYLATKVSARASGRPPTLRAFTWWARLFAGVLPTLLLCGMAWRRYANDRGDWPTAVAILLYALATPANAYAHLYYGHQLAACLLFLGVGWLADALEGGSEYLAAAGGAAAGAAVAVEYGAVFAGIPIAVVLVRGLVAGHGLRNGIAAVIGALIPVLLLAAYHQAAFDSPFSTGYHHAVNASFAEKHGQGLLGLGLPTWNGVFAHILSPKTGLFVWAPLFPLALFGLAQLAISNHQRCIEARLHLAIFLVILLVGTGLSFEGGWRIGPRYLVVALPGLILGWAHALGQLRTHPVAMGFVACFAFWALLGNVMAATLWPHIDPTNINGPISDVLVPLLRDGYQPYGPLWLASVASGAWWIVGMTALLLLYALFRLSEPGYRMTIALVAGVGSAAYFVFWLAGAVTPEHELAERNLRYIERTYEPQPKAASAGRTRSLRAGESRRSPNQRKGSSPAPGST